MSASCARVGTTLLVSMLIHVTSQLNAPHGGTLRPLISDDPATVATLKDESALLMTVRARDRTAYRRLPWSTRMHGCGRLRSGTATSMTSRCS